MRISTCFNTINVMSLVIPLVLAKIPWSVRSAVRDITMGSAKTRTHRVALSAKRKNANQALDMTLNIESRQKIAWLDVSEQKW